METKEDPLSDIDFISDQFRLDDKDLSDQMYLFNFQSLIEYQLNNETLTKS